MNSQPRLYFQQYAGGHGWGVCIRLPGACSQLLIRAVSVYGRELGMTRLRAPRSQSCGARARWVSRRHRGSCRRRPPRCGADLCTRMRSWKRRKASSQCSCSASTPARRCAASSRASIASFRCESGLAPSRGRVHTHTRMQTLFPAKQVRFTLQYTYTKPYLSPRTLTVCLRPLHLSFSWAPPLRLSRRPFRVAAPPPNPPSSPSRPLSAARRRHMPYAHIKDPGLAPAIAMSRDRRTKEPAQEKQANAMRGVCFFFCCRRCQPLPLSPAIGRANWWTRRRSPPFHWSSSSSS